MLKGGYGSLGNVPPHPQIVIEPGQGFIGDPVRNAEWGFGDPAGDQASVSVSPPMETALRMASSKSVASNAQMMASGTVPGRNIERVPRPDTVHVLTEVVFEPLLNGLSDLVGLAHGGITGSSW